MATTDGEADGRYVLPLPVEGPLPEIMWGFEDARTRVNLISAMTNLREQLALSTAELARRADVAQDAIAEFEAGSMDYSLEFVQRLCRSMGTRLVLGLELDPDSYPHGTAVRWQIDGVLPQQLGTVQEDNL